MAIEVTFQTNFFGTLSAVKQHRSNYALIKTYLEQLLNAPVGGNAETVIEINVSLKAAYSGTFDIPELTGLTPGAQVSIKQAAGPYTGKGTLADESEDMVIANGYVVDESTIRVFWQAVKSPVMGFIKFIYSIN